MENKKEELLNLFNEADFLNKKSVQDILGGKNIILYGGGSGCTTFNMFVMQKYGFNIHAILDKKFKEGDFYFGAPAYHPFDYLPTNEEINNSIVVITVGGGEHHQEIKKHLIDIGFKNIILASDIYEYHLLFEAKDLSLKGFQYYLGNKQYIMDAFDLLEDDESRDVFLSIIKTHMERRIIPVASRDPREQYFPKDIFLSKGYTRFVNCGAYTGDTVLQANALSGKLDAVVCFEPDTHNFKLLSNNLREQNDIAKEVVCLPCAVFSEDIKLYFESGNKLNSSISTKGNDFVQCITIDHAIPVFSPTFINMDIEGSELDALKGAENILMKNAPDLAICVYHSPNHIWDIPLYLKSLNVGYVFYLRNYTSYISETVLYATVR